MALAEGLCAECRVDSDNFQDAEKRPILRCGIATFLEAQGGADRSAPVAALQFILMFSADLNQIAGA